MGLFGQKRDAGGKGTGVPLRLLAETVEDVQALAALTQDAALRIGDMTYDSTGRHFTLRMNRFCHEAGGRVPLRASAVLRVSSVNRVQIRGMDMTHISQPVSLLDISADPLDEPAFALTFRFAGEGAKDIRITVECLDILLMDLAAPRRAKSQPKHLSE